jgi:hypothetical protein
MTRLEKALAALDAAVAEPPKAVAVPRAAVREAVVEVSRADPNWTSANRGRVRVGILEQMYWSAVDRAFNPKPFAEVVSGYNPTSRERMPGYDPEEDR